MIELINITLWNIWTLDLAWALAISGLAGVVLGFTGFGSALVMMPLMAILYGPVEALGLLGICSFLASLPIGWTAARQANWPEVGPMVIGLIIAVPIGMIFLFHFDPVIIKRIIGVSVIAATLVLYVGWNYKGPRNILTGFFTGALSGGLTGFTGIGGPVVAVYILASSDTTSVQRSGIVITAVTVMGVLLASLIWNNVLTPEIIGRGILLTPIQVIFAKVGEKLFHLAPERFFRVTALGTLILAGIAVMLE